MSGVEIAGLLFATDELFRLGLSEFQKDISDYGFIRALLLHTLFLQAQTVIRRIRRHVVGYLSQGEDEVSQRAKTRRAIEAEKIKGSYALGFNMIAVAGAIVAQIAITATSLENLEQTHWTAQAAFLISLISGILSVYFACLLQLHLGSLHSPEDVMEWLTKPVIQRARRGSKPWHIERIASFNSAMMLVAPSQLLNWSLLSFLVGIGIYYGLVWTRDLGELRGQNANLALLVVYVVFTAGALGFYFLPEALKALANTDSAHDKLLKDLNRLNEGHGNGAILVPGGTSNALQDLESGVSQDAPPVSEHPEAPPVVPPAEENEGAVECTAPEGPDAEAFRAALKSSIRAQEANLQALRVLQARLESHEPQAGNEQQD